MFVTMRHICVTATRFEASRMCALNLNTLLVSKTIKWRMWSGVSSRYL